MSACREVSVVAVRAKRERDTDTERDSDTERDAERESERDTDVFASTRRLANAL